MYSLLGLVILNYSFESYYEKEVGSLWGNLVIYKIGVINLSEDW